MTTNPIQIPAPEPSRVPEDDHEMTFFEHLGELRTRLLRAILGLIPAVAVGWVFKKEIKDFLEFSYGNWFNQMSGPDDNLILFKKDDQGKMIWSKRYNSYETAMRYYNYASAAGIIYSVDVSKPAGERITIKSMADGTPFDIEKQYKVALNSYRGSGGGGHLTNGAGIPKEELESRI